MACAGLPVEDTRECKEVVDYDGKGARGDCGGVD